MFISPVGYTLILGLVYDYYNHAIIGVLLSCVEMLRVIDFESE